jgi:hypothetical protein
MRWFGVIKPLHPIICITGTETSDSDISWVNSTYEFVAGEDGVGLVAKGLKHLSRLGYDKVRALGFIGHFATPEDAIDFKTKLENDFYLDPTNPRYNILTNNCQHFVAKILEDLKTYKNFVPGGELYGRWGLVRERGKNMLDLDIMQGMFLETISKVESSMNPSTFAGSIGSVSVGSLAGSSAASSAAPVSTVAAASAVGGAAAGVGAYSIVKQLENIQVEGGASKLERQKSYEIIPKGASKLERQKSYEIILKGASKLERTPEIEKKEIKIMREKALKEAERERAEDEADHASNVA